jgi:hypothetical protein
MYCNTIIAEQKWGYCLGKLLHNFGEELHTVLAIVIVNAFTLTQATYFI